MYKISICAVEISQEGKTVLSKAQEIASKFGGKMIVVSVLPYTFLPKDYQKELKEKAIPGFNKIATEHGVSKKNRVLKVGKPYEVICNVAEKKQADLIILDIPNLNYLPYHYGINHVHKTIKNGIVVFES